MIVVDKRWMVATTPLNIPVTDERGRRLLMEVLSKETLESTNSNGHSMLLPGAGRWLAERSLPSAEGGAPCKRLLWFMGLRAEEAAQFEYYRYVIDIVDTM